MNLPPLDPSKLTEEQRSKLEKFKHDVKQLQTLEDIASIAQDMHGLMEKDHQDPGRKTLIIDHVTGDDFVKILKNMNDAISRLGTDEKEEMPDFATPVVAAVRKLEAAINSAKPKDVAPIVNVEAPNVTVEPSRVDMTGIEKAVSAIPKAFAQAIKLIPKVEIPKTDNKELLKAWEGISEQLESIDTASRMKPQFPTQLKVVNSDGTAISSGGTSSSLTVVGDSAASIELINANVNRKEVEFYNTSTAILYLLKDNGVASTTNFTVKLSEGDYYSTDAKTSFYGLWASDAGGSVYITETI